MQNTHARRRAIARLGATIIVAIFGFLLADINTANAEFYQVYLYYDHGNLVFDRDYDKKVIVLKGGRSETPTGGFRAEVIGRDNSMVHSTNFDPRPRVFEDYAPPDQARGGLKIYDEGKTVLQLSYAPIGSTLKIYNPANALVLEYDISYLASCNLDNKCEAFLGETTTTCPQDCGKAASGEIVAEPGNKKPPWLLWMLATGALGAIGFILWKVRRIS